MGKRRYASRGFPEEGDAGREGWEEEGRKVNGIAARQGAFSEATSGADEGPVPTHFEGVLEEGPAWARRLSRWVAPLDSIGRLLGKLLVVATWITLIGGWSLIAVGRDDLIGLSETSAAYRPVHYAVIFVAVFAIALTTGDAYRFGRQSGTVKRRAHGTWKGERRQRSVLIQTYVDGLHLPNDPDLSDDPNGFTGTGTGAEAPGAPYDHGMQAPW